MSHDQERRLLLIPVFTYFSFGITRRYAYKTGLGFWVARFYLSILHRVRAIAFLSLFKNASWETR